MDVTPARSELLYALITVFCIAAGQSKRNTVAASEGRGEAFQLEFIVFSKLPQ